MKMGELFTIFLTNKGEIYSLGENLYGQLGIDSVNCDYPIRVQGLPLIS